MSVSDFSRASWRLKLGRAEHHFRELEGHVRTYCDRHPYEPRRDREGERKPKMWSYRLRITEEPGPEIALALGDVLHNVRAALDHLATALVPKGLYTFFPIEKMDIWAEDATGQFIIKDDEARERFHNAVKHMHPDAVAIIHQLQPRIVNSPKLHPLAILSKLENTDKHRNLVLVGLGLRDAACGAFHPELGWIVQRVPFCYEGTQVARFDIGPGYATPPESEMQVQIRGAPHVTVDVGVKHGYVELVPWLRWLLDRAPVDVFDRLEPFVRL